MKNPGVKPEDKEWLWEETPRANPQPPWYPSFISSEETQEKNKVTDLEI